MGCVTSCCFQDSKDDTSETIQSDEQPTEQTPKQNEENKNNLKNGIASAAEIALEENIEVLANKSARDTNHSFEFYKNEEKIEVLANNSARDTNHSFEFHKNEEKIEVLANNSARDTNHSFEFHKNDVLIQDDDDNIAPVDKDCSPTHDIGLIKTLAIYGGKFGTVNQRANIINIPFKSDEGKAVIDVFSHYNTNISVYLKITGISRIENRFLYAMYLLKKEEMKSRNNGHIDELNLFHGTKKENVKSICNDNFDWRRYGSNMGNRFGKGVSFTPKPTYAVHYCDNDTTKIMFLAKVLVCKAILGNENMSIPIDEKQRFYDTSVKPNIDVVVKYGDNEFFPAYRISFVVHNINPRPPQRWY